MGQFTNHNGIFLSFICGKLLGDGCITLQSGRKPRFQFIHAASDFEWCNHCYSVLNPYIPLNPPKYRRINDTRILKGYTESFLVQSRTAEIITYLESIWYKNRRKVIPFDFLEKYLDERTLAWWYLDDGHLKMNNGIPSKINLSTDSFTSFENQQLIELLERKYFLCFSLDGQNRLVLYDQLQIYYFYRMVEPFLHHSMSRKMLLSETKTKVNLSKRTTLYLPEDISILKPTRDINNMLNCLPKLYEIVINRTDYLQYYINSIYPISKIKNTKSYQIIIDESHWMLLYKIKNLTGLNNSQITAVCFSLSGK